MDELDITDADGNAFILLMRVRMLLRSADRRTFNLEVPTEEIIHTATADTPVTVWQAVLQAARRRFTVVTVDDVRPDRVFNPFTKSLRDTSGVTR